MLVFDRAHFDRMTAGDTGLQREVIGLFRMQIGGWERAFAMAEGWRDAIHTMKGSARGIGLAALAAACETAEHAADAEAPAALAQARAALAAALAALDSFAADTA